MAQGGQAPRRLYPLSAPGTASVAQRPAALNQARARYLPVLDHAAHYSVADGGRTIDVGAVPRAARLAAVTAILATAVVWPQLARRQAPLPAPSRTLIVLPEGVAFGQGQPGNRLAMSPDATNVAFVARRVDASVPGLWLQTLADPDARMLDGTMGAAAPIRSPDSRQIIFSSFNANSFSVLKRIPVEGGSAVSRHSPESDCTPQMGVLPCGHAGT